MVSRDSIFSKKKKNVKSSGMEWRRQDGGGIGNPVSIGPLNVALYLPNDSEHPWNQPEM